MNTEKPIPAEISFSGNSTLITIRVEHMGEGMELTQKIADSTLQLHYVGQYNQLILADNLSAHLDTACNRRVLQLIRQNEKDALV